MSTICHSKIANSGHTGVIPCPFRHVITCSVNSLGALFFLLHNALFVQFIFTIDLCISIRWYYFMAYAYGWLTGMLDVFDVTIYHNDINNLYCRLSQ